MTNKTTKQKLLLKFNELGKQRNKIKERIDIIDYKDRLKESKQFEGKFYRENSDANDIVRCVFVYSTNKVNCEPMGLFISYWKDNLDNYFDITSCYSFNPKKWEDDRDKYVEITKKEYMSHYQQVFKRIRLAINKTSLLKR